MTTAARPTWNAAVAGPAQGGNRLVVPSQQTCVRDQPAHLKLKTRDAPSLEKDELLKKLDQKETERRKREREDDEPEIKEEKPRVELPSSTAEKRAEKENFNYDVDADDDSSESEDDSDDEARKKKQKAKLQEDDDDESDDDDNSDSDEEEELMKELMKIKKERAEAAEKKRLQEEEEKLRAAEQAVMYGNPLLATQLPNTQDYSLSKRWYEDVVFKNQSKDEPKLKKRFINDTIRNDFHKKFLERYIK